VSPRRLLRAGVMGASAATAATAERAIQLAAGVVRCTLGRGNVGAESLLGARQTGAIGTYISSTT